MKELRRELKQMDVWGLALGAMIGTGCFFLPGTVFLPKSGPAGAAAGIFAGMCMIMVIGVNYSYLIMHYPKSGGEYVFVKETYGSGHAWICGWFLALAYVALVSLNGTAATMILRYLFPGMLEYGKLYTVAGWEVYLAEAAVSGAVILLTAAVNLYGVKLAGAVQTAIALFLVLSVGLLAAAVLGSGITLRNLAPGFAGGHKGGCVFASLAIAPFLFIGFDCIPQAAGEYRFSNRKTLKILLLAILFAASVYGLVMLMTGVAMPWQALLDRRDAWATGAAIGYKLGKGWMYVLGFAMLCAALSGMNAFLLSSSRLVYAMAQDGALPRVFAKISGKRQIPGNAVCFVTMVSLLSPWLGREVLNWIVDMTSVGGAVAYCYTSMITYTVAKKEGQGRYKITGMLGALFSVLFLGLLLVPGLTSSLSKQALAALGIWSILGIVFGKYHKRKSGKHA